MNSRQDKHKKSMPRFIITKQDKVSYMKTKDNEKILKVLKDRMKTYMWGKLCGGNGFLIQTMEARRKRHSFPSTERKELSPRIFCSQTYPSGMKRKSRLSQKKDN